MGLRRITARTLMIVAAAALVLSYLSIFCNPAKFWIMTIFGLLYLPLLILNITLLVMAILRRSKALWIPLIVLLPSIFIFQWHFQPGGTDAPRSSSDIKVITYNVGRFDFLGGGRQACRDSVFGFLRREKADIICLQEITVPKDQQVESFFHQVFPEYHIDYYVHTQKTGSYGNVTLSRFPVAGKGKISFDNSTNMALYGDYIIGGRTIRIYNCHFQSYNISLARIGAAIKGRSSAAVKEAEDKMKFSLKLRPKQVDAVIKNIAQCPLESFVSGDFNDTPMSYTYWRLSKGRRDSFIAAGKGFGATYSMLKPLLRIDYLLFPGSLAATSHRVEKINFSDHYPVIGTFSVSDK